MGQPEVKRQTTQGAATRKRIVEAAVELVCERGYSGTSVDAICKRAGVVKTALYWHFGSKDGLLTAVIDDIAARWVDEILDEVYATGEPVDRLDRLLSGLRDIVENRSHMLRVIETVINESANVSEEAIDAIRRLNERALGSIADGFSDAMGAKLPDLDLLAHLITGQMHGILRQYRINADLDLDRYFAHLRRTVLISVQDLVNRTTQMEKKKKKKS